MMKRKSRTESRDNSIPNPNEVPRSSIWTDVKNGFTAAVAGCQAFFQSLFRRRQARIRRPDGLEEAKQQKPWKSRRTAKAKANVSTQSQSNVRNQKRSKTKPAPIKPGRESKEHIPKVIDEAEAARDFGNQCRASNCVILFLGVAGSGKSCTISNLFKTRPIPETTVTAANNDGDDTVHFVQHQCCLNPTSTDSFTVVDVPGLVKGQSDPKTDAELMTSLPNYLEQLSPNRIPNLTFIVGRFDDNRFEGEQSDFTRMLKTVRHVHGSWTDEPLSNVVFLLTFADSCTPKDVDHVKTKLERFRLTVWNVFPKALPLHIILMDNRAAELELSYRADLFKKMEEISIARDDVALKNVLPLFAIAASSIVYDEQRLSIRKFLPRSRVKVQRLMECLLQGNELPDSSEEVDDDDESVDWKLKYEPTFIPMFKNRTNDLESIPPMEARTCLPSSSCLVMADGKTVRSVRQLQPGDKLLNKKMKSGVISKVHKLGRPKAEALSTDNIGKIYYSRNVGPNSAKSVLMYMNGRIRPVDWDSMEFHGGRHRDYNDDEEFYVLQLDTENGSIITGEGFVLNSDHKFIEH